MFYCNDCAAESSHPTFDKMYQSWGRCETCGQTAGCNDVPTTILDAIDEKRTTAREVEEAIASIRRVAE